ncbi:hypothetical protein bcgnr5390_17930 [Bacillus luti]|nr:hypothetical protein BC2903_62100 [Bacillus cereus]
MRNEDISVFYAEKVMGWELVSNEWIQNGMSTQWTAKGPNSFSPQTNPSHMWHVTKNLEQQGVSVEVNNNNCTLKNMETGITLASASGSTRFDAIYKATTQMFQ